MSNKSPDARAIGFIVICCLLLGGGFLFVSNAGWTQEVKKLELREGEITTLPISSAQRIAIGDPTIADVKLISNKKLMLMAKAKGRTNLIIWDASGQREFIVEVIARTALLDETIDRIKELLKASNIEGVTVIQKGENIFLIGEIEYSADIEQVDQIVQSFPGVINLVRETSIKPLVQLDVEVVEMSVGDRNNLGIDWFSTFPVSYELGDISWAQEGRRLIDMTYTLGFADSSLLATLNFLMTETDIRILAKPSLVVSSGKEGKILVGGEMPVLSSTQEGTLPSIQWKSYGISLNIRPTVLKGGNVNIAMAVEVSDLTDVEYDISTGSSAFGVGTRSAETEVILKHGETMVIGGLIKSNKTEIVHKLPILGDIPLINKLFRSTETTTDDLDLVVFITPLIIERDLEKTADDVVDLHFLGRQDVDAEEECLKAQK